MDKVFVGKIVNTHGVHGEFRIRSDFERKNEVFKVGNEVIINNKAFKMMSYRVHKGFDMITVEGLTDLNSVIPLKGSNVYVDRSILEINNDDYLYEDLLGANVIVDGNTYGVVSDYTLGMNPLIYIKNNDGKEKMVPFNDVFISSFDKENNNVYLSDDAKGLL